MFSWSSWAALRASWWKRRTFSGSLGHVRRQDLEGHEAVELGVAGADDGRHAADADRLDQLEVGQMPAAQAAGRLLADWSGGSSREMIVGVSSVGSAWPLSAARAVGFHGRRGGGGGVVGLSVHRRAGRLLAIRTWHPRGCRPPPLGDVRRPASAIPASALMRARASLRQEVKTGKGTQTAMRATRLYLVRRPGCQFDSLPSLPFIRRAPRTFQFPQRRSRSGVVRADRQDKDGGMAANGGPSRAVSAGLTRSPGRMRMRPSPHAGTRHSMNATTSPLRSSGIWNPRSTRAFILMRMMANRWKPSCTATACTADRRRHAAQPRPHGLHSRRQ